MTENCNLVLMKQWVLSLMIPLTITCAAQTNHTVTGSVVDSAGIAIPYASVVEEHRKFGMLTDANGRFEFSVPDSLKASQVIISCIGYESKSVSVSNLTASSYSMIVLNEKPFLLQDISVTSSRAKFCAERRGSSAKRSKGGFLWKAGSEMCVFIPSTPGDSAGIISAVRYFIGKRGISTAPFRVVLYKVDSITKGPGESLLEIDTIVHASKGARGWKSTCEPSIFQFQTTVFLLACNGFRMRKRTARNWVITQLKQMVKALEERKTKHNRHGFERLQVNGSYLI